MAPNLKLFVVLSILVTFGDTQGTWSSDSAGRSTWQTQQGLSNNNPMRPFGTVPPPPRTSTTPGNVNTYPQNRPQPPYGNVNNYPQNRPQPPYGTVTSYPQNRPQPSNGVFNNPSATRPFGTVPPPRYNDNSRYPSNDPRYGANTPPPQNWAGNNSPGNWDGSSRPGNGYGYNSTGLYPSLSGIRN